MNARSASRTRRSSRVLEAGAAGDRHSTVIGKLLIVESLSGGPRTLERRGWPGKRARSISRAGVGRTASYSFTAVGRVPAAVLPARTSCGCCPGSGRFRRPSLFEEGM
jgi:hypothetical protein